MISSGTCLLFYFLNAFVQRRGIEFLSDSNSSENNLPKQHIDFKSYTLICLRISLHFSSKLNCISLDNQSPSFEAKEM